MCWLSVLLLTLPAAAAARTRRYCYKLKDCVVQIKGKCTNVTLDGCTGTGCVFDSIVSGFETVGCKKLQCQAQGTVPSIMIDKTDSITLYLPALQYDGQIVTSLASEVNIMTPGASEEDDMIEKSIPEQFVTTCVAGKWTTTPSEHV